MAITDRDVDHLERDPTTTRESRGSILEPESLVGIEHSYIHPVVIAHAEALVLDGFNVRYEATIDPYALDPQTRFSIESEVADLEVQTMRSIEATGVNPNLLPEGRSAFTGWGPLTKRAIALHNIYRPLIRTLGEGIDPTVYDRPLFSVSNSVSGEIELHSAKQVVEAKLGPEKAARVASDYDRFIHTPIDDASRRIWQGSLDGSGVRTRAISAMSRVADYLAETKAPGERITTASLACGAAGPMFELARRIGQKGLVLDKTILADMDAMALASAQSLADHEGIANQVELKLENLVDMNTLSARNLSEFIEPGSVDVVDLLGLFEYFPRELAVDLIQQVRKIIKPGGMIVFGNMIDNRPQQTFFTQVSMWPPLEQRSLPELFDIVQEAGFSAKDDAEIILPPQGVYAVVAIKVPNQE